MGTIKESRFARIVDKIAVTSEPGLTNAPLMLTNEDLKPGEHSVASLTYYILCKVSPIPATSKVWLEVGDEIENPTLAYGVRFDEDGYSGSGSGGEDVYGESKGSTEDLETGGVNERKVAGGHITDANLACTKSCSSLGTGSCAPPL